MIKSHLYNNSDCTILSGIFNEKKFPYARVIRKNKSITKFVEEKDTNDSELQVNELFCSHYCLQNYFFSISN